MQKRLWHINCALPASPKRKTGKVSELLARNTAQGFCGDQTSLKVHCVRESIYESQSELWHFGMAAVLTNNPKVSVLGEFGTNLKYFHSHEVDL